MLHSRKIVYFPLLPVILDNTPIGYSYVFKFLGLNIDLKLNWKKHIQTIQSKISSACGVMYQLRNKLPLSVKRILYFSICYPYFNYCNVIWTSCHATTLSQLFITQKRIIRTILGKRHTEASSPLFKQLKILKLNEINKLNIASFVYKSINGLINSPIPYLPHVIVPYNLRREPTLHIPLVTSDQSQRFVHYRGVKTWNDIDQNIRNSQTLSSFKRKLKSYFISCY